MRLLDLGPQDEKSQPRSQTAESYLEFIGMVEENPLLVLHIAYNMGPDALQAACTAVETVYPGLVKISFEETPPEH